MELKKKQLQNNKKKYLMRLFFVFFIVFSVIILFGFIVNKTGIWNKINSIDKIKKIVESGGALSVFIFVILQILQTTILQVPAVVVTLAGTLVFGSWKAFILSFMSIMLGSIIMFFIGRIVGRKFLYWLIGKDTTEKWIETMSKGKYLFVLMMAFPLFPDDILCCVAGLTNMKFWFFFFVNLFARGITIASITFLGNGEIIPFSGWGVFVWILIFTFVAILFYISVKFQNKIDNFIKQVFSKKKR